MKVGDVVVIGQSIYGSVPIGSFGVIRFVDEYRDLIQIKVMTDFCIIKYWSFLNNEITFNLGPL